METSAPALIDVHLFSDVGVNVGARFSRSCSFLKNERELKHARMSNGGEGEGDMEVLNLLFF